VEKESWNAIFLRRYLKKIETDKFLDQKNKKLILDFDTELSARGISEATRAGYLISLIKLANHIKKPFRKITRKDLIKFINSLEKMRSNRGSVYEEGSKLLLKSRIKRFFKWLNGDEEYPTLVKWMKTLKKNENHKLPSDLLTVEEIKRMADASDNFRDKAIIMVAYESGARLGEIEKIKIKNVQFDKYGATILVNGKTGGRRIRLIDSEPDLRHWINHHPFKDNPESPLWVNITNFRPNQYGSPLGPFGIAAIIKRLGKRAKIKKRIHPHLLRHSRATHLANYLTEAQMKELFGWVQSSGMASIYVHLSGRDVDNALLKIHGLVEEEKKKEEDVLKPMKCPRCEEVNPATAKFCNRCSFTLDLKTGMQIDEKADKAGRIISVALDDPKIRRMIIEKAIKSGLKEDLEEIV